MLWSCAKFPKKLDALFNIIYTLQLQEHPLEVIEQMNATDIGNVLWAIGK